VVSTDHERARAHVRAAIAGRAAARASVAAGDAAAADAVRRWRLFGLLAAVLALAAALACSAPGRADVPGGDGATSGMAWQALRSGGHALLLRHALAPGTGDPPTFALTDCATQRNLSVAGRDQARRLGAAIREAGVRVDRLLSSRWCRALETARLMAVGPVEPFPPIDSFFQDRGEGAAQTRAVEAFLAGLGDDTVVMVTHQVNITALTGIFPRSGEGIVVKPSAEGLAVVGRLSLPAD
jgi:phosphohistidine phosphatase SixA